MSHEENPVLDGPAPEHEEMATVEPKAAEQAIGRDGLPPLELIREEIALALERLKPSMTAQSDDSQDQAESMEALKQALAASRQEAAELKAEASRLRKEQYLRQTLSALGVENLDLAVKAVHEDIVEDGDRQWVTRTAGGAVPAQQYLTEFLKKNRELLPARRLQGAGMPASRMESGGGVDLEEIRPGMDPATLKKVRDAIGRAMGVFPRGS